TTAFIDRHAHMLLRTDAAVEQRAAVLAAALLLASAQGGRPGADAALTPAWPLALRLDVNGRIHAATVMPPRAHRYDLAAASQRHDIEVVELAPSHARFICDGVMDRASWWRDGDRLWLASGADSFEIVDTTREAAVRHAGTAGDGQLRASMNGRVVAVAV